MAAAVIGALRVVLGADTAAFSTSLRGAESGLQRFAARAARIAAVAAAALTAAFGAMAVGVKGAIDRADELIKMGQSIGIPVEELSRLAHVADLAGVSLEGLATSVGRLSRNMFDVASGAGAAAGRAFEQLGISVKNADGTLRSSTSVLGDLADRFASMPDGAQKTALAMQLMGRAGATMIPLLNGGSAAINEMMQEAERLGLVIDQKTAAAAERFNDNLTRLGRVKDGIIMKLTAALLPALESLAQRLTDAAINGDVVNKVAAVMIGLMDYLGRVVKFVYDNFYIFLTALKVFIALKVITYLTAFAGALVALAKTIRVAGIAMAALNIVTGVSLKTILLIAGAVGIASGAVAALFGNIEEAEASVADLAGNSYLPFQADALAASAAAFDELGTAAGGAGARIAEGLTPNIQVAETGLERLADTGEEVGRVLNSAFSSAFDKIVDGSFDARDALKALLVDFGRMLASQGFQALSNLGGSLVGSLFGGGVTGAPLNLMPAFAKGGSFRVGGSGGIDSQLVQFRASPGELVDVRAPGQDMGGGGFAPTINVDARGANLSEAQIKGVLAQGLAEYDRNLPSRVHQVAAKPYRR